MRSVQIWLLACLAALALPAVAAAETFDWDVWRGIPVQNGGRQKPLDTLSWETLRMVANRGSLTSPQTKERLDPTAAYVAMLLEWQGWDHADKDQLQLVMDWRPHYFHLHKADAWDHAPLLRVDFLELRTLLHMEKDQRHLSPAQLAEIKIEDEESRRGIPFSAWADKLFARQDAGEELTVLEQKALELADRYWAYQNHRMGRALEILPLQGSEEQKWISLGHLLLAKLDPETDPTGELRAVQQRFAAARTAYQQQDAAAFNLASRQLATALRKAGSTAGAYPSASVTSLEVAYNRWAPFRFGWVLMLLAVIGMLLYWGSRWTVCSTLASMAYVAGLLAIVIGFGMRMAISGRAPVTNMYESVVYVGAGVALFGLIFERIYRKKHLLTAAAVVATLTLILADNCPVVLDPSVRPLEPVLRSNFWLVTHVMTITLSYAALALALGIGNITLGYYLAGSENREAIQSLSRFTYKAIQIGVLLLAAGIILGGVWADYSWGRFWGWDPKEVWALVALLGYLAVLHARYAGWVGHRGLAALSVGCFSLVIMAWYGVNFVLGAGLHSYGFGAGGQAYVSTAVACQLLYAGVALLRTARFSEEPAPASRAVVVPTITKSELSVSN